MSESNRGERSEALNDQLGVLVAIVLSCLIVGFFAYLEGYQDEAEQNSAKEYAEIAKANAVARCKDGDASATADCVYDHIATSQDQAQREQDLDAQKWMARSAIGMLILTALALYFIRATLGETAKMAADTKELAAQSQEATGAATKAADASVDATNAMVEANKIARDIGSAQTRAHVVVEGVQITLFLKGWLKGDDGKYRFNIKPTLKNLGNTAATQIRYNAKFAFSSINRKRKFESVAAQNFCLVGELASGQSTDADRNIIQCVQENTEPDIGDIIPVFGDSITIVVRCDFFDVFGERWFRECIFHTVSAQITGSETAPIEVPLSHFRSGVKSGPFSERPDDWPPDT
jgi:hypothetical protein